GVAGRDRQMEREHARRSLAEDAVEGHGAEVHVQVQPAAKALDNREGAAAAIADTMAASLASVELKQYPRVHRQHSSGETVVPCEQVPQPVWQREEPLEHPGGRENVVPPGAAPSVIRRPPQLGQKPRPLHEKGTVASVL